MKKLNFLSLLPIALLFIGCTPQNSQVVTTIATPSTKQSSNSPTSAVVKAYKACNLKELGIAPELGSPKTIEGAINLINALPRPLDIPCFISALNRPLDVNLTNSAVSVQPAAGNESPRIFIMSAPLIIAIAISGEGSYLMEFSEFIGNQRSIKGELKFPILSGDVSLGAPFERINTGLRTTCNGCHRFEVVTNSNYPGVIYESMALKPAPTNKVQLYDFQREVNKCNNAENPSYRCNLIYGIFNQGSVGQIDFPTGIPTFFESFRL